MTPFFRPLVAISAAALAVPLAAQDTAPAPAPLPDFAKSSAEEVLALFRKDPDRWTEEPCTFGVPVTAALEAKLGKEPPVRRARLFAEALCADEQKRYADGMKAVRAINAMEGMPPSVALTLYFARRLEDAPGTLDFLRGLDGEALEQLSRDNYWPALRMIRAAGQGAAFDALALEWFDAGKFAFIEAGLHESLAMAALRDAAGAGRADAAAPLLAAITSPVSYIELLTLRQYAPFWPQIEARAGEHLATVGAEHVAKTRGRMTNAPADRDRFSEAAHALHFNGQFADAIALAQRWRERAGRGAAIEEGDAWALNIEAYAHDSLGQPDKADAVFDELAALSPDEHPWVVNFVINRASRLVGQGRWEEGVAATLLARGVAEQHGSTYAKLILARQMACALPRLGREAETAAEAAYLRENAKEGIALAVAGLMCLGQRDEAAAMLLAALRDEAQRETALDAFMTDELDLFYTATILPEPPDLLADHPELAAELARHMRPMPEAYVPQAALRRVARKEGAVR